MTGAASLRSLILAALRERGHAGASGYEMRSQLAADYPARLVNAQLARLRNEGLVEMHDAIWWRIREAGA